MFGASTKSGDNWTDHKIESAAATGAEHVVSVAYVPNEAGTGAKLVMRVDGGDAQTKDITGLAYLDSSIKARSASATTCIPPRSAAASSAR